MGIHDQLYDKELTQRAYHLFSPSLLCAVAHRFLRITVLRYHLYVRKRTVLIYRLMSDERSPNSLDEENEDLYELQNKVLDG